MDINKEDALAALEEVKKIKDTILKSSVALANAAEELLKTKTSDMGVAVAALKSTLADFNHDLETLKINGLNGI